MKVKTQSITGGLRTKGRFKETSPVKPLITVITVVLNGERHLEQAIQSVIKQDYPHIEYIVIDGASTDGTLDIIHKYEDRIDYWVSEPDSGIYEAMNKGIDLAEGEVIALLNADDYYELNAMQVVAEVFVNVGTDNVFYANHYMLQEDLHLRYKSYPHMRYWRGMPLCHQAMFVPKRIYRKTGSYSLSYSFAADYDFLLRSLKSGVRYVHIDQFLVNYRNTGLTNLNYTRVLKESRKINAAYFPVYGPAHTKFLLSYYKTIFLFWLQKIIAALFGKGVLQKARTIYLKTFIAKEYEVV